MIRDRLSGLFKGTEVVIKRVGHTAVPGLAAKPIIDMDVIVPSGDQIVDAISGLSQRAMSTRVISAFRVERRWTLQPSRLTTTSNVVAAGTKPHLDHVLLRDYLRRHPDAASATETASSRWLS
jgi:GrpB-like predicted nucleotidyltransferase (UPF0157 family)